ncbi:hypothetical protein ZOSMA_54G00010 [Zostera marina]|uniref:Uncharacterized protein n=1 Tax=Zostera marina TaxID=29655 RepID=A0A0K9NYJ1_ZOSMR|nr:hypothetical protein ZOSMA_54G00010 [Zostera marina]
MVRLVIIILQSCPPCHVTSLMCHMTGWRAKMLSVHLRQFSWGPRKQTLYKKLLYSL